MTSRVDDKDEDGAIKSFLGHLDDLRTTLLRCAIALISAACIAAPLAPSILNLLKSRLTRAGQDPETFLRVLEVEGGFSIAVRIVLWSALVLSSPFISFFVAAFVFPGLTPKERRGVLRSTGFAVILFIGGVLLCYFGTLPLALKVMFGISEWVGVKPGPIMITSYVVFCLRLLLGFGLAFELPVLLVFLGYLGIISSKQLRERRSHVVVILLVVAMLLTPPDIFTQLMMAGPMVVLYELSIWIIVVNERRKSAPSAEETGDRDGE